MLNKFRRTHTAQHEMKIKMYYCTRVQAAAACKWRHKDNSRELKADCGSSKVTELFFFAFFRRRRWTTSGAVLRASPSTSTTILEAVWTRIKASGASAAILPASTDTFRVSDGLSAAEAEAFEIEQPADDGVATSTLRSAALWGLLSCWWWRWGWWWWW